LGRSKLTVLRRSKAAGSGAPTWTHTVPMTIICAARWSRNPARLWHLCHTGTMTGNDEISPTLKTPHGRTFSSQATEPSASPALPRNIEIDVGELLAVVIRAPRNRRLFGRPRRREAARVTQWVATNKPMMLISTPAIATKSADHASWANRARSESQRSAA
jgi:hypothetical protein